MPKLNQILAIEKGVKNQQNQVITEAYKTIQKPALFAGIFRKYTPKDDDGDKLPSEQTLVQQRSDALVKQVFSTWGKLLDITMTKDSANMHAKADVVVNGKVIVKDVPVSTLLNMEKQLIDVHTFISKLPVLNPSEEWHKDGVSNAWASKPAQTTKSKKIPKPFIKAPATDKHPAQVEVVHDDVLQGTWETTHFSGAMPANIIADMLARVEELQIAVKFARETANLQDAPAMAAGEQIFSYVLGL